MNSRPDNSDDGEIQAPEKLVRALKSLSAPELFIAPSVDRRIVRAAAEHLGSPRQSGWRVHFGLKWAAALGLVLLLVTALQLIPIGNVREAKTPARNPADLNSDGNIDVLDAFTLAKQMERGNRRSEFDLNRDGKVDQRDVDFVAGLAVHLPEGETL